MCVCVYVCAHLYFPKHVQYDIHQLSLQFHTIPMGNWEEINCHTPCSSRLEPQHASQMTRLAGDVWVMWTSVHTIHTGPTLLGQYFESFQVGLRSGAGDPVLVGAVWCRLRPWSFLLHLWFIFCYCMLIFHCSSILLHSSAPPHPQIWTWHIHQHIAAPTFILIILSHAPWQAMARQKAWIQPACATSVLRNLDATGALLALDEMWKLQADGGPWYTSGLLSKEYVY